MCRCWSVQFIVIFFFRLVCFRCVRQPEIYMCINYIFFVFNMIRLLVEAIPRQIALHIWFRFIFYSFQYLAISMNYIYTIECDNYFYLQISVSFFFFFFSCIRFCEIEKTIAIFLWHIKICFGIGFPCQSE